MTWRELLFSTAALIVDGETELGALPAWYTDLYGEGLETLGASIFAAGGKSGNTRTIRELDAFGIPWVLLIDGDSLQADRDNIWAQLAKAERVSLSDVTRWQSASPAEQIQELARFNVYVSGTTAKENFESAVVKCLLKKYTLTPPEDRRGKVLTGRWLAENVPCPETVEPVLACLRERAGRS